MQFTVRFNFYLIHSWGVKKTKCGIHKFSSLSKTLSLFLLPSSLPLSPSLSPSLPPLPPSPSVQVSQEETNLGGQDYEQTAEDVDEVEEEVERVTDIVVVSVVESLHNQLGVKENEPTEQNETTVHIQLWGGEGGQESTNCHLQQERSLYV